MDLAASYDAFFSDPILVAVAFYAVARLGWLLNRKRSKAVAMVSKGSVLAVDVRTLHRHPAVVGAATAVWAVLNMDVRDILMMEVW